MYKFIAVLVAVFAAIILTMPSAHSQQPTPTPSPTPEVTIPTPPPAPHVVASKKSVPQKTITRRRAFVPADRPSSTYVHDVIIPVEAARWGASASRLSCRIFGESGYHWYATNGQYVGVGQFATSTFYRGVASIGSRHVKYVRRVTWRHKHTLIHQRLSDGSRRTVKGTRHRQRVVHVRSGWIPPSPEVRHTWAQVRIMARAMVGLGGVNDSEWEVRC